MLEKNKIYCGDCLEVMKSMPSNFVDTLICDPPYGLKFMSKKWDYDVPSIEIWKECLRVLKHGGTALIFAGSRTQHRMACNVEDAGFILKDTIMWLYGSGFPKATDISKQLDKGVKRKITGRYKAPDGKTRSGGSNFTAGNKVKNADNYDDRFLITEPTTFEAKLWNGWKSHGLKPAYEPILVCMKSNEGSYADNALKYGVSGLNIDGGRIGFKSEKDKKSQAETIKHYKTEKPQDNSWKNSSPLEKANEQNEQGRFPANLIFDEEAARLLDEQGEVISGGGEKGVRGGIFGNGLNNPDRQNSLYYDKGGASRFFYCAKASKSERNLGCEGLEEKDKKEEWGDKFGAVDRRTKTGNKSVGTFKNSHPTVKPISLMEYLCELTKTPTGGIVLDPFAGSGTTGIACKKTGRDYILIEKEKEYCEIAEARIKATQKPLL